MSYGPKMKSPRNAGRGHETPERKKAKARSQKHRSSNRYLLEENQTPASEQVVEKTLGRLRSLGNQIFALSPFTEYFNDWLVNLKGTLSDFDSTSAISSDDQFAKECSQILSNIERDLEERRHKETAHDGAMKSLSDNRSLLERIDEESATKIAQIEGRKNSEIRRQSKKLQGLKEELARLAQIKTGIFRSISTKAKEQKEAEVTQTLNSCQTELELAVRNFTAEQEKLRNECEKRKQPIIEQIRNLQKEIDNLEIDGSLEARQATCEALVNAINALLQRKTLSPH